MATDMTKVMSLATLERYRCLPVNCAGLGETVEPNCGDILRIGLNVNERQMVVGAGYEVSGDACHTLLACAAAAVSLVVDKPVLAAYTVSHQDIALLLSDDGNLNAEHAHCALMAELSLKKAAVEAAQRCIIKKEVWYD